MAIRYCGRTKINCIYRDKQNDYKCSLSVGSKPRGTIYLGVPSSSHLAVDSPIAYNDTSHAAIAHAMDEGKIDTGDIEYNESLSGYKITTKATRR